MKSRKNKTHYSTVSICESANSQLTKLSEMYNLPKRECIAKILDIAWANRDNITKMKNLTRIKDMDADQVAELSLKKIEAMGKRIEFLVSMIKEQDKSYHRPTLEKASESQAYVRQMLNAIKEL